MSLKIGKYIKSALGDDAVQAVVAGRVFPVIAPMDRPPMTPYIVFASNGLDETSTKDGLAYDTVTEEILVFGKTLDQVEELADLVRDAMFKAWRKWNKEGSDFEIQDQTMRAQSEDFDLSHDGFYIPLIYTIETAKK